MKSITLLKAITSIDDTYVEDALAYRSPKKQIFKQLTAFASVAACVCIVLFGTFFAANYFNNATLPGLSTDIETTVPIVTPPEPVSDFVIENGTLVAYTGNATEITIPDEVTEINASSLNESAVASNITSIHISKSVTEIDKSAFVNLTSLSTVTVEKLNPYYISENNILGRRDGTVYFDFVRTLEDSYKFADTIEQMQNDTENYGQLTDIIVGKGIIKIRFDIESTIDGSANVCYAISVSAYGYEKIFDTPVQLYGNFLIKIFQTDKAFVISKSTGEIGDTWIFTEDGIFENLQLYEGYENSIDTSSSSWYNGSVFTYVYREDGKLGYERRPRKYLRTQVFIDQIRYCVSLDEIAMEEGYVTFVDGAPVYYPEKTHTANEVYDIEGIFNDWYTRVTTDENITDDYFTLNEIPKVSSLEELLAYNKKHYVKVFDINDAANLPLRLVGMTFAEIEAEFGPLECPYMMYGGSPVYTSEKLPGIRIVYISADSTLDNGWHAAAPYETPDRIDVGGGEYYIYPGIYIGMPVEELVRVINDYQVEASPMIKTTYDIVAKINDTYGLRADFKIPSEMYDEFLDYYHSVENDIDPHDGWLKLIGEFEEELANNLSGELLGYSIYG